ncbi:MAG: phosphatidate cytidylyltransferase [Bryobacteraceae bacterium]|nr:phosphatidate cytidylyltransferase [Bryobacteraceae bacterium]MDW8376760.1 phosphatidate cytidylyltransferase [Bryobacterales bacterium]
MKRAFTAFLLIPSVVAIIFGGPMWLFAAVVLLLAVLCFHEYSAIAAAQGVQIPEAVGHLAGAVLLFFPTPDWRLLALIAIFSMVWGLRAPDQRDALPQAALLFLGIVYVYGAWRCALYLRTLDAWWIFFAVSINWVGDSAAFFVGKAFGKHKMAPRVSPSKTWEGAAAALVLAVIYGVLLLGWVSPSTPKWQLALVSLVANLAGQFGDLAESAMKRGAGLKDSGHMLPGHGGWLDRLDSSLFSMPAVALYVSLQP